MTPPHLVGSFDAPTTATLRGGRRRGGCERRRRELVGGIDRLAQGDEGVHGHRADLFQEDRVEVDLVDLGMVQRHAAHRLDDCR